MGLSFKLYVGPMGAGKTSEAKRDAERRKVGKYTILWFRAEESKREGEPTVQIVTHNGDVLADVTATIIKRGCEAEIERICRALLEELGPKARILLVVDEVHFLRVAIVAILFRLALLGVEIECLGIDVDFLGRTLPTIEALRAVPEVKTLPLTAVCPICGEDATRTLKLVGGKPAGEESPSIEAGQINTGTYEPRCYACYIDEYRRNGMELVPFPRLYKEPATDPDDTIQAVA